MRMTLFPVASPGVFPPMGRHTYKLTTSSVQATYGINGELHLPLNATLTSDLTVIGNTIDYALSHGLTFTRSSVLSPTIFRHRTKNKDLSICG